MRTSSSRSFSAADGRHGEKGRNGSRPSSRKWGWASGEGTGPASCSGGQRQRVAIARALATKPRIVLADEPTANLDSATGEAILEVMKKINREMGTTFIFSTHDANIVRIADHVIRLHDGKVESEERREGRHAGAR